MIFNSATAHKLLVAPVLALVSALAFALLCPAEDRVQRTSELYVNPELIEIEGYAQDAMEPCISLDGKYLFFNNSNEEKVDTHIHFAKRVSGTHFKYLGLLPGARSDRKDMAPSLDRHNAMYFTSLRTFDKDHKSIYTGNWQEKGLIDPKSVDGNISPSMPFWINMDCCISPDGDTLIISRTQFLPFQSVPHQSDLLMATRSSNNQFNVNPQSDKILKSINTSALEYAPAITEDGLELYFTRATTAGNSPIVTVLVARRRTTDEPFGAPERLTATQGFCEAPSLTADRQELFFHKKDGKLFHIYRASRSQSADQPTS